MKIRDHDTETDGTFVIAEACSNHGGKLEYALALIEMAFEAGANAVKFQRFRVSELERSGAYDIKMLKRLKLFELPDEWLPKLRCAAHDHDLAFLCTPFDVEAVKVLEPYVDAWKIRHTDWENSELKREISADAQRRPIIQSVPEEVWWGEWFTPDSSRDWAFLYCNRGYPTLFDELHLPKFPCIEPGACGFSDHTTSVLPGAIAVARGAKIVEKHFALDGRLDGLVDGPVSIGWRDLRVYISKIRSVERMIEPPENVLS